MPLSQKRQAGDYEFQVTPEMVRAFKFAYLDFADSPRAWRYPEGCEKILAAVLEAARPGDVRSLDNASRHTRRKA